MKRLLSYGLPVVLGAGLLFLVLRYAIESLMGASSTSFLFLDPHLVHRILQFAVLGFVVMMFIFIIVFLWRAGSGDHFDCEQHLHDEVADIKSSLARMSGDLPSDRAICLYNDIRCHVMRAEHYLRTGDINQASTYVVLAHELRDDIEQVEMYRRV